MRDTFIKTLIKETEKNSDIILITGDLGFGVLDEFIKKFPDNYINAGVAEQNMTGMAAGLAMDGRIVFTYSIGNFPTLRCLEQIRNDICYHNLNVNIVSIGGGFSYGALGMSHHATEDIAIMRSLPGMIVLSPCGLWEAENITREIIKIDGPSYLRVDKSQGEDLPTNDQNSDYILGKSRKLQEGEDCTIFVTGGILEEVQIASKKLLKKNIKSSIISIHTVKPIDQNAVIDACDKTSAIITVEEHNLIGGLGSTIAEILMDRNLSIDRFLRIGLRDEYSSVVGSQKYLRKNYEMDSKSIYEKIFHLMTE